MTKLRKLDILLNNPQVVYFPGQVIQGQVIVELSAAMKMRGRVFFLSMSGSEQFPFFKSCTPEISWNIYK